MFSKRQLVHSLALGLVMAVMGFCYATSTSRSVDEESPLLAGGRIVGSGDLRILNPSFLDNTGARIYDFGDVCFGSQIQRYVSITGGVRPYRTSAVYTHLQVGATGVTGGLPVNSSMLLGGGGLFIGTIGQALAVEAVVTVSDGTMGTIRKSTTGLFRMGLFTCGGGLFRFAVDQLNSGVLGQSYLGKVDTIGGVGDVKYSVVAGTLTVDGTPRGTGSDLTPVGLDMADDGTVCGRPLEVGQISFRCRAVDSLNRIAKDRTNLIDDQVVTLNIENTNVTATELTLLSCSVKGDIGKLNKDTLKFSALANLGGNRIAVLFGSYFSIRLGGATYAGQFNAKGQVVNARGGPLVFSDGSKLTASVNARNGLLKGSITKASLSKALDAETLTNRGIKQMAFSINITRPILAATNTQPAIDVGISSAEFAEFSSRKAGEKFGLDYSLGRIGEPKGGTFQVLSCKGIEKQTIAGNSGTAWQVKFMAIPRYGIDQNAGFDAISSLVVRIGTNFRQSISGAALVSSNNGGLKLNRQAATGLEVEKFDFNARKFTGSLQTSSLGRARTGLFQPSDPNLVPERPVDNTGIGAFPEPILNSFSLGVDFDRSGNSADFTGEVAKQIYAVPAKKTWADSHNLRK